MTTPLLMQTLQQALSGYTDADLCVAFSGGPDSTALLHALAQLPQARERKLRALHVDHGLHADSATWAQQCRDACQTWQVPLSVLTVHVNTNTGSGIEAAAREARYTAMAGELQQGETLLTAQHQDDQAETVLLKLLRGAGPEGLGGMRAHRALAHGNLWRPLLDTPRSVLVTYLQSHGLAAIEDPSNQSPQLARSYLRADVLPRLQRHWPKASRAINHAAMLQRQAADFIAGHASAALDRLYRSHDHSLDAHVWLALHPALQVPVLEQWLHGLGLAAPGLAHCAQLRTQIEHAHGGRVPLVQWPGTAVHVWRGRLHAHLPLPDVPPHWRTRWHDKEPLKLPAACGVLHWQPTPSDPPPEIEVRLGEIGVHLRPAGDTHTRELRDLFQQHGLPPWQRRRCPLLYTTDNTLLAVADLWSTNAGDKLFAQLGSRPQWLID